MDKSKNESHTIPVLNSLALRIYSDTRPLNWKIANLQKGLVLVLNGREMVEAGAGFGFPMLQYSGETYFSGTAKVYKYLQNDKTILRKDFFIDMIKRNTFKNMSLESSKARSVLDYLGEMNRKCFRVLKLKDILVKWGVGTSFSRGPSKGKITFVYDITGDTIKVKADFRQLNKDKLMKISVLNEQGSRFFRLYRDSNGRILVDEHIGSWKLVNADWASITDLERKVAFKLKDTSGATFYRGQEFIDGFLDWIGLEYEIDSGQSTFEYPIKLLENRQKEKDFI
ncbi:hypothetical protein KAU55_06260 [Candidatus Bathyarchaeota archaeon]|nr:hypothetical protein [Candidatus Bathyarchaeota archaeon]